MSVFKKLNQQDAYITTYTARKSWVASGSQYRDLGIQNIVGLSGDVPYIPTTYDNVYGGPISNSGSTSYNRRLIFESTKHLYYSAFSGSLIATTSSYENYLQSSYNISGSRKILDKISVISLPKEMYGTHIEPGSVSIKPDSGSLIATSSYYVDSSYANIGGDTSIEPPQNLYVENTDFMYGSSFPLSDLDYLENEGDIVSGYIDEETIGEYVDQPSSANNQYSNIILDDGEGNLYLKESNPRKFVGNVVYPHGQLVITDPIVSFYYNYYFDAVLNWKSNLPIYTHNYHCRVKNSELNYSLNKTALKNTDGQIADNIKGSNFQPYISTLGLYNESNELVAVTKMSQPLPKSGETDMVIVVKLDMNFGTNRLPALQSSYNVPAPAVFKHTFTFKDWYYEVGRGGHGYTKYAGSPNNKTGNIGSKSHKRKRKYRNYDTYQIFWKKNNNVQLVKGSTHIQDEYHMIAESEITRPPNGYYKPLNYVDVVVEGNQTVGYTFTVFRNDGITVDQQRRPDNFYSNILLQYLYENNLTEAYTYTVPTVVDTLQN